MSRARVPADRFAQALAVEPGNADIVNAGGNDRPHHDSAIGLGVMRSRDGGKSWVSLDSLDLPNRSITSLTLDLDHPGRLYAGAGGSGVSVLESQPPP
jgi:hypothetical protein